MTAFQVLPEAYREHVNRLNINAHVGDLVRVVDVATPETHHCTELADCANCYAIISKVPHLHAVAPPFSRALGFCTEGCAISYVNDRAYLYIR